MIVAVFQFGWFPGVAEGPIEAFLPVLMFAIGFGLSMDYEVFLVSSIHEEWTLHRDTDGWKCGSDARRSRSHVCPSKKLVRASNVLEDPSGQ